MQVDFHSTSFFTAIYFSKPKVHGLIKNSFIAKWGHSIVSFDDSFDDQKSKKNFEEQIKFTCLVIDMCLIVLELAFYEPLIFHSSHNW